jgi:hypothetical protein
MDGSMWYARGGGGIFEHVDGPYAGPHPDPVIRALGFDGLSGGGFGAQDGETQPAERGVPIAITADSATIDDLVGQSLADLGFPYSKTPAAVVGSGGWPTWAKVTAGVGVAALLLVTVSVLMRR